MTESQALLIVGASARSAAMSALRAGMAPWCVDLFADADLARRCPVVAVPDLATGLSPAVSDAPPGPWMYTGGLENHAQLVAELAAARPLWGNGAEVLRRVRDPLLVAESLQRDGLPALTVRPTAAGLPRDGGWLRKGRRSAGGVQVQVWNGQCAAPPDDPQWYFQRFVPGTSIGAICLAAAGRAVLLGASEQLLAAGRGGPFRYAGSVGPLPLDAGTQQTLERLGDTLARDFELRGLFGVDAVVDQSGTPWLVEVNPRYTASVEVLERASRQPLLAWHAAACTADRLPAPGPRPADRCIAKRILFAPHGLTFPAELSQALLDESLGADWPDAADIPRGGTRIGAGEPILTVFSEAATAADARRLLNKRLDEICRLLEIDAPSEGALQWSPQAG